MENELIAVVLVNVSTAEQVLGVEIVSTEWPGTYSLDIYETEAEHDLTKRMGNVEFRMDTGIQPDGEVELMPWDRRAIEARVREAIVASNR